MKQSMICETEEVDALTSGAAKHDEASQAERPRSTLLAMRVLTAKLMREVESLTEIQTIDIQDGIDFYQHVTDFEIGLIRRALAYTRGHQGRAARLLNLKVTTLNSKIKQYKIKIDAFANGYPMKDSPEVEVHQHV